MSARLLNCTTDQYYADPCSVPSLSSSIAKVLIQKSPSHAYLEHPRLGNQRKAPSEDMDEGTLVHKLLLGENTRMVIIDADDFRTKDAKAARDEARAARQTPVLRRKYDAAVIVCEKIRANIRQFGIDLDGASEVSIEWTEDGVLGDPVVCRCRMDHTWLEEGRILELKKAESAHPRDISRAIDNYAYDLGAVAYTRALEALKPEFAGRVNFGFLFVEIEPPYSVVPVWMDGAYTAMGTSKWRRAVRTWERCLASGQWPGYVTAPVAIAPPPWALAAEELADAV